MLARLRAYRKVLVDLTRVIRSELSRTRFLAGVLLGNCLFFPLLWAQSESFMAVFFTELLALYLGFIMAFRPGRRVAFGVSSLAGQFIYCSGLMLIPSVAVYLPYPTGGWVFTRPFIAYWLVFFVASFLDDMTDSIDSPASPAKQRGSAAAFAGALFVALVATIPTRRAPSHITIVASAIGLVLGMWSGKVVSSAIGRRARRVIEMVLEAGARVVAFVRDRLPLVTFFGLGYVAIVLWFAAVHYLVWWGDRSAYSGLAKTPGPPEFIFFSVATIATVGDGRTSAASDWARLAVGSELVVGFLWNTIVLAAVAAEVGRALREEMPVDQPTLSAAADEDPPSPS
jgi:hypothetical protein